MKKYSGLLLIIHFLITGCKHSIPSIEPLKNKTFLGNYINQSYLDAIRDSIAGTIPFYCSSITFKSADTVEIDNGIESFTLAFTVYGDTCTLISAYNTASGLKNLYCLYINDSVITLLDTGFTMKMIPSHFIQTNSFSPNFPIALNKITIAGKYQDAKAINSNSIIEFTQVGKIIGLKEFINYKICYAGDCLSEPIEPANILLLSSKNTSEVFSWDFDKSTSILHIYSLSKPSKDIKGERKVTGEFKTLKKL
ncbi:MAG: hypothetical protein ABIR66_03880 [Saprospiraceae bacterium]